MRRARSSGGFTLLELMIVIVIVGVLASVALPSYSESVRKGNRADAKNVMLDLAQMQERYYTNNTTYLVVPGAPTAAPGGWKNYSGNSVGARKFSIAVAAGTTAQISSSFTITASASNGYSDPTCGTMTLDNLGAKAPAACW